MKSTANRIRSVGNRMTIELSEWFRPTCESSIVVPPSSMTIRSVNVTCGTAVGRFSAMIVRRAFSWATIRAVSAKTSPPEMWSAWSWL
jgi:hypothetical protein